MCATRASTSASPRARTRSPSRFQDAIVLIAKKRKQEEEKHLKKFDDDLEILNGHWGSYIAYKGKNYRIPKNQRETATDLTLEQCMEIVNNAPEPKAKVRKKRS